MNRRSFLAGVVGLIGVIWSGSVAKAFQWFFPSRRLVYVDGVLTPESTAGCFELNIPRDGQWHHIVVECESARTRFWYIRPTEMAQGFSEASGIKLTRI